MIASHIAHDCKVGNNVIIANNVPLGGHVIIEDNVVIGGNSAVQQFTRIGKMAMIGGMTGVLHDVIPYGLSTGNRNSLQGLNLIGLRRAKFENKDILGLSNAYKEIFATQNVIENIKKLNDSYHENLLVKNVIDFIKKNNCKKVLFAGKVDKPNFSKLKLDLKGIYYIPRIINASKLGDAAILKEIIKILALNKIKTENSLKFNQELSLKKGIYSKIKPNIEDQLNINKAINKLNSLQQYNFSQGVVVRDNKVVAIEGKGGTKKMLKQIRNKKIKNLGVLVKFPKKKQDLRIDLPTIGLNTLIQSKNSGLKGVVVKNKKHVFLDKEKCIQYANKK